MPPSPERQIQFLVNLQRLLDEGLFAASYKFALLLALADLSVGQGDDSGAALALSTDAIAVKFIQYYWRQALPYPAADLTAHTSYSSRRATTGSIRAARRAGIYPAIAAVATRKLAAPSNTSGSPVLTP